MSQPPALATLLSVDRIALRTGVGDVAGVFEVLGHLLSSEHEPAETIERLLAEREVLGSTALGNGVGLPHCRLAHLTGSRVAIVRVDQPIAFGADDGRGVTLFVGVTSPVSGVVHLQVLAHLASIFRNDAVRSAITETASAVEVFELLREFDRPPAPTSD